MLGLVLRENKSSSVLSYIYLILAPSLSGPIIFGLPLIFYGEIDHDKGKKNKGCMSVPSGLKRQRKKGIQITVFENGLAHSQIEFFDFFFSAMSLLVDRVCFLHLPFSKKNTSGNVSMLLLN